MEATTWQHPDQVTSAAPFEAPPMGGCSQLDFNPTIEAKPTTNLADSPSGLAVELHDSPEQRRRRPRRRPPAGGQVHAAAGPDRQSLRRPTASAACSAGQIGYTGLSNERQLLRYDLPPVRLLGLFHGQLRRPEHGADRRHRISRPRSPQAIETLPGLAGNVTLSGAQGWLDRRLHRRPRGDRRRPDVRHRHRQPQPEVDRDRRRRAPSRSSFGGAEPPKNFPSMHRRRKSRKRCGRSPRSGSTISTRATSSSSRSAVKESTRSYRGDLRRRPGGPAADAHRHLHADRPGSGRRRHPGSRRRPPVRSASRRSAASPPAPRTSPKPRPTAPTPPKSAP